MSLKVTYSFAHTWLPEDPLGDPVIVIQARLYFGPVVPTKDQSPVVPTMTFAPCQSHIMIQHFAGASVTDTLQELRWDGTYIRWSTERVILHIQEENRYCGEDSSFHAELPYDPSFAEVIEGIAALE